MSSSVTAGKGSEPPSNGVTTALVFLEGLILSSWLVFLDDRILSSWLLVREPALWRCVS
jgi:hypothetical protein